MSFYCNFHNYKWQTKWSHIQQGHWCKYCGKENTVSKITKYNIEYFKELATNKNIVCLNNEYNGWNKIGWWWCGECYHTWQTTFNKIQNGSGCPKCYGKFNNSIELCKEIAKLRNGECLSTEYKNLQNDLVWKCNKHNYVWKASLANVKLKKTWCELCSKTKKTSKGELELLSIVQAIYPDTIKLKGLLINKRATSEIDIFIPSLNKAIEYDGKYHQNNQQTLRDELKDKWCLKNGIKLYRVNDVEFRTNKQETIKKVFDFLKN
jgi:hypothetical protein